MSIRFDNLFSFLRSVAVSRVMTFSDLVSFFIITSNIVRQNVILLLEFTRTRKKRNHTGDTTMNIDEHMARLNRLAAELAGNIRNFTPEVIEAVIAQAIAEGYGLACKDMQEDMKAASTEAEKWN